MRSSDPIPTFKAMKNPKFKAMKKIKHRRPTTNKYLLPPWRQVKKTIEKGR